MPIIDENPDLKPEDIVISFKRRKLPSTIIIHHCGNPVPDCLSWIEISQREANHLRTFSVTLPYTPVPLRPLTFMERVRRLIKTIKNHIEERK